MVPHLPPVDINPNSAMNEDSDGPSSNCRFFVLQASVVSQISRSRG